METTMDNKILLTPPELDQFFYVQEETSDILKNLEKLSNIHPVNVLMTGRQGCGKSSLIRQFAAYFKRPLAVFQI